MWNITQFVKTPYRNVEKIFPLKQHAVEELVEYAAKLPSVKRVTIFGSSVESRCNPWSDVDVFIEGSNFDEFIDFTPEQLQDYDILFDYQVPVTERVYKDIKSKGVIVYERNIT